MEAIPGESSVRNVCETVAREALPSSPARPDLSAIEEALRSKEFQPLAPFRNGHAQTLAAYAWPRRRHLLRDLRRDEERLFEVGPGIKLLAHCRWQESRRSAPTVLLVHGLEGSSSSSYVLGTAHKAFRAGFNVVRLNVRNCGGTEHLTSTLYHSGLSEDIRGVVEELIAHDGLPEIFLAGFSMGGNLVLKLAGEFAAHPPRELRGVCAVSPSLDLSACADAIERGMNRLYQWNFMRSLRSRIRRKQRLFPDIYDTAHLRRVRTLRQFDDRYTAVHAGFKDAADYYARASALPVVPQISVPTLVIHAQDDPFIPFHSFRAPAIGDNPYVILLAPRHGGHVGFLNEKTQGEDRHWAENRIVEFFRLLRAEHGPYSD